MFNQADINTLNSGIAGWSRKNKSDILKELDVLGVKHSKNSPNKVPLRRVIKDKLAKKRGLVNKITYSMPRSAVFLHKGYSRKHGKGNPRIAKEFYGPVVDKNIDELAAIVADGQGSAIINSLNI